MTDTPTEQTSCLRCGHAPHMSRCPLTAGDLGCGCDMRTAQLVNAAPLGSPETYDDRPNRRAIITAWPYDLERLLDLPKDLRIVHGYGTSNPVGYCFVVEGESLDPQPYDRALPKLDGAFGTQRHVTRGEDGSAELWTRWGWQPADGGLNRPDTGALASLLAAHRFDEGFVETFFAGHRVTNGDGGHLCDADECVEVYDQGDPVDHPDMRNDPWAIYFDPTEGEHGQWVLLCPEHRSEAGLDAVTLDAAGQAAMAARLRLRGWQVDDPQKRQADDALDRAYRVARGAALAECPHGLPRSLCGPCQGIEPVTGQDLPEESNLVKHARAELTRAGWLESPSDKMGEALLAAVRGFARGGWSGGSVGAGMGILQDLLAYKPLTPLTTDPDEWEYIAEDVAGEPHVWQSKRRSDAFSNDGGLSYYLLDDPYERRTLGQWVRGAERTHPLRNARRAEPTTEAGRILTWHRREGYPWPSAEDLEGHVLACYTGEGTPCTECCRA